MLLAWESAVPNIINVRRGRVADDLGQVCVLLDEALHPATSQPSHVLPDKDLRVTVRAGADPDSWNVKLGGDLSRQVTGHHFQHPGECARFRYLAGVAGNAATLGESYDVGGPEVMTYRQMIERIAALRGRRRLIVEVPVLSPRLSSYWLHLVTPVRASVARPLVEGLRNPTVARDERIRELVPFSLTPFDDAARAALATRPI